jgi:hypothetical protein
VLVTVVTPDALVVATEWVTSSPLVPCAAAALAPAAPLPGPAAADPVAWVAGVKPCANAPRT